MRAAAALVGEVRRLLATQPQTELAPCYTVHREGGSSEDEEWEAGSVSGGSCCSDSGGSSGSGWLPPVQPGASCIPDAEATGGSCCSDEREHRCNCGSVGGAQTASSAGGERKVGRAAEAEAAQAIHPSESAELATSPRVASFSWQHKAQPHRDSTGENQPCCDPSSCRSSGTCTAAAASALLRPKRSASDASNSRKPLKVPHFEVHALLHLFTSLLARVTFQRARHTSHKRHANSPRRMTSLLDLRCLVCRSDLRGRRQAAAA